MKKSIILSLVVMLTGCGEDIPVINEPEFFTSDIDLFWQVFDNANFSEEEFQSEYIDKGTIGLRDYSAQKELPPSLQSTLRSQPYLEYYKSIRGNTLDLSEVVETSKQGFSKLKSEYSDAKLSNVYFLIGSLTAGGRVSDNGLLIAIEMFTNTDGNTLSDLSEWHQNVIRKKEYLPSIVVHELIHKQQRSSPRNSSYRTLLEQSLTEGMADFISHYLLQGEPFMNEHLHSFADPIESQLWDEFKVQMDLNYKSTEWLYTGQTTSKDYPADLGYYVGYKIVEAFSNQFEKKSEAISSMLTTSNYYDILQQSKYEEKFN